MYTITKNGTDINIIFHDKLFRPQNHRRSKAPPTLVTITITITSSFVPLGEAFGGTFYYPRD